MKKLIAFVALLLSIGSQAQIKYGTWSYGQFGQDVAIYNSLYTNGHHGIIDVKIIRPNVALHMPMNWAFFDSVVYDLVARQKEFGVQVMYGQSVPDSFTNGKATDGQYCWTMRGKTGNDTLKYPYYLHDTYKTWFNSTLDSIFRHISEYPEFIRERMKYYHVAEGSTGDNEPYKGEPIWPITGPGLPGNKSINFQTDWLEFREAEWQLLVSIISKYNSNVRLLINAGNDAAEQPLILEYVPNALTKEGTLSHDVFFYGSKTYYRRNSPDARGEWQGWVPDYSTHQNKEGFALISSALTGGLEMLNITQTWVNVMSKPYDPVSGRGGANPEMLAFFNKYTNDSSKRAFIVPMDAIDFLDTVRFSKEQYGEIARHGCPCDSKGNDSAYLLGKTLYNLANAGMSQDFVDYKKISIMAKYMSWSRVLAIRNLYPHLSFVKGQLNVDGQFEEFVAGVPANNYNHDFGVDVANWEKNATLMDRWDNITPLSRIGADTTMLGRFAAKGTFLVELNNKLTSGKGYDSVYVAVWYYDSTAGTPSINVSVPNVCGATYVQSIPVANTKKWIKKEFIVPMRLRPNSWDMKIESGNVALGLLEFEVVNK